MRLAQTEKASLKGKQEFRVSLLIQNQLIWSVYTGTLPWPPSLIHQWLLLSFATEVVKFLYHCCFNQFPQPPLSFYLCFAAATTIDNLLFTLITRCEVRSLFCFVLQLWYACAVCPHTHLFMWHLTSKTGWYIEKTKRCDFFFHFYVFHLQVFTFFCSYFSLFCPC